MSLAAILNKQPASLPCIFCNHGTLDFVAQGKVEIETILLARPQIYKFSKARIEAAAGMPWRSKDISMTITMCVKQKQCMNFPQVRHQKQKSGIVQRHQNVVTQHQETELRIKVLFPHKPITGNGSNITMRQYWTSSCSFSHGFLMNR